MADNINHNIRSRSPSPEPEDNPGNESLKEMDNQENDVHVSNKSKKLKQVGDLSPEEEQSMIEWLEDHPIIYNKKLKSYKETTKKERMWLDKSLEMKKPVAILKTWYTSLRTRFGKISRKKSGEADTEVTERNAWVLRNFDFLRPHIHEVQKKTTVSMLEKLSTATAPFPESIDESVNTYEACTSSSTTSAPETPCSSVSSKPRNTKNSSQAEEALLTRFENRSNQIMAIQKQVLENLKPSADHERDAFIDWVRSVIMELEHGLWRRCQREISTTVYGYITENDLLKRQQVVESSYQVPPSYHAPPPHCPQQSQQAQSYSHMWQPHPNQWPIQSASNVSVWQSQDANWVSQQNLQHPTSHAMRPVSMGQPHSSTITSGAWEGMTNTPHGQSVSSHTNQSSVPFSHLSRDDHSDVPQTQE